MKRIVILMLVMTTTAAFAQRPNHGRNGQKKAQMAQLMEELSAQQLAELETKKLTLALDLNDAQQTQMLAVQTEIAQDRKAAHTKMKALKESDEIKKPTLPPVPIVANIVRQFFSPGTIAITIAETNVATNQDLKSDRLQSSIP